MHNYQVQSILRSIPTLHKIDSLRRTANVLPTAGKAPVTEKKKPAKADRRKICALAEAVILQSIEDLWNKTKRRKSIEFFMGDGFSLYADMAGMKVIDRLRLFRMLRKLDPTLFDSRHARKLGSIVKSSF